MTSQDLMKKLKASVGLIYAMYENRMTNRYCVVEQFEAYIRNPYKYKAFNLSKGNGIVEIRIFPAVKSYENLMWRVQFLRFALAWHSDSFGKKMASLKNKNSLLYVHMLRVFTPERIETLIQKAIKYHIQYVAPLTKFDKMHLTKAGINF
jgi:hypothetical protein